MTVAPADGAGGAEFAAGWGQAGVRSVRTMSTDPDVTTRPPGSVPRWVRLGSPGCCASPLYCTALRLPADGSAKHCSRGLADKADSSIATTDRAQRGTSGLRPAAGSPAGLPTSTKLPPDTQQPSTIEERLALIERRLEDQERACGWACRS